MKRDLDIEVVAQELLSLDPDGLRWSGVIRHTYDMLYNGQEAGRYRWESPTSRVASAREMSRK